MERQRRQCPRRHHQQVTLVLDERVDRTEEQGKELVRDVEIDSCIEFEIKTAAEGRDLRRDIVLPLGIVRQSKPSRSAANT